MGKGNNMKRYVLLYSCHDCLPCDMFAHTLFIERSKEDWQKGRLNLLGGSIEDGETPEEAAIRELREEAGVIGYLKRCKILGKLVAPNLESPTCEIYVVKTEFYRQWNPTLWDKWNKKLPVMKNIEGTVHMMNIVDALKDSRLVPNLKQIIPLCKSGLTGWKLYGNKDDETWGVDFSECNGHLTLDLI